MGWFFRRGSSNFPVRKSLAVTRMTTSKSALHGIRTSGDYFISTFLFGVMFGIAAVSVGLETWQALLMCATSFTASGQFAALEFWKAPLPFGTIALSVALVSSRNLLLGMAMTHHFDGHSLRRRIVWLALLNDPGVVNSFRLDAEVDRLGYVTGYGISMMVSWLLSTYIGLNIANLVASFDLGAIDFAGPLVIATMMMLFARGSKSKPLPWIVSGGIALILFEVGAANYLILLSSVLTGMMVAIWQARNDVDTTEGSNDG
jgi:predicted branched-subunit amino acid permease